MVDKTWQHNKILDSRLRGNDEDHTLRHSGRAMRDPESIRVLVKCYFV